MPGHRASCPDYAEKKKNAIWAKCRGYQSVAWTKLLNEARLSFLKRCPAVKSRKIDFKISEFDHKLHKQNMTLHFAILCFSHFLKMSEKFLKNLDD